MNSWLPPYDKEAANRVVDRLFKRGWCPVGSAGDNDTNIVLNQAGIERFYKVKMLLLEAFKVKELSPVDFSQAHAYLCDFTSKMFDAFQEVQSIENELHPALSDQERQVLRGLIFFHSISGPNGADFTHHWTEPDPEP